MTRRQFADHRGISVSAVGKHVRSGVLAPAIDSNGRIDRAKADRLLAANITHGPNVSSGLAEARRRKLAGAVALLKMKIDQAEAAVVSKTEAGEGLRFLSLKIAEHIRTIIQPLAVAVAGQPPLIAFERMTAAIHTVLTELLEVELTVDQPTPKAKPKPLGKMSADELLTLQNDLHAKGYEIDAGIAAGALVDVASVCGSDFERRLTAMRQHMLAAPTKLAPVMAAATPAEAEANIASLFADAVAELACWSVSEAELRAAAPNVRFG